MYSIMIHFPDKDNQLSLLQYNLKYIPTTIPT